MKNWAQTSLIALALCAACVPAFAGTPVTLRATTELNRPAIRLADVFDGLPAELDRDIALSPAPGKSVTYDARVLSKLAEQYRLDWQAQSLADRTVLTRAATQITPEMISEAVVRKIKEGQKSDKLTPEIQFDNKNLIVSLPADRAPDFSIANFAFDEQSRRFRGDLIAQTSGNPVNQPISGRVIYKKSIPVLSRRLAGGTTIGESDLSWITMNEAQLNADMLTDASQLVGQELRHDQGEGEVLRSRDIIPPRLVTRGSLVTMKIETPLMLITSQGRAMQDGAKGEVVRVTNIQSNRVIEGTVEASGVIRIGTFRKIASAE